MADLTYHIERLREKPHHVRHGIALGVAAGFTALVAVVWATVLVSGGTLALKTSEATTNENPDVQVKQAITETKSAFSSLMGAAGAAMGATSSEAALSIVTSAREESTMKSSDSAGKTVIPF
ncbi:MAG: hypothetical protein AB199_02225 [Parcubacteria bacterium C7867-004]|nr:MAG: hypothetical protein AB199_02225 [Parcubacteria bacterium C7867-004]